MRPVPAPVTDSQGVGNLIISQIVKQSRSHRAEVINHRMSRTVCLCVEEASKHRSYTVLGEYIALRVCSGGVYHLSCCDSCWFAYFDTCQLRNKISSSSDSGNSKRNSLEWQAIYVPVSISACMPVVYCHQKHMMSFEVIKHMDWQHPSWLTNTLTYTLRLTIYSKWKQ